MMEIDISINGDLILLARITRYRGNEDEECSYIVEGELADRKGKRKTFGFAQRHLYSDGGEVLAIKALQRIVEHTK